MLRRAAIDVTEKGVSERQAAAIHGVSRTTLKRFILATSPEKCKIGSYQGVAEAQSVFTLEQAQELAKHIKAVDDVFHGMSARQCRELAYQYASRNKLYIPKSWENQEIASCLNLVIDFVEPEIQNPFVDNMAVN